MELQERGEKSERTVGDLVSQDWGKSRVISGRKGERIRSIQEGEGGVLRSKKERGVFGPREVILVVGDCDRGVAFTLNA